MFNSYFKRKSNKVLTFNIVHFPNFKKMHLPPISAILSSPKGFPQKRWGTFIRGNTVIIHQVLTLGNF